MGLFGSTKTYVSSTLYNLAGELKDRPNFLKTLVTSHQINGGRESITNTIQRGYIAGPGVKMRRFGAWAEDNYDVIGVPRGNLYAAIEVSETAVASQIPHDVGESIYIGRVEVKLADYSYWAEQFMLANYPELIDTNWVTDYIEAENKISIVLADGTNIAFTPSSFQKDAAYIFALYTVLTGEQIGSVETGEVVQLSSSGSYPDISGWTSTSTISTPTSQTLTKVVKTTKKYSDGRPDEVNSVTTTSNQNWTYYRGVFEKTEYKGAQQSGTNEEIYSVRSIMRLYRDASVATNVSSTKSREDLGTLIIDTIVETTEEILVVVPSYRIDTQDIVHQTESSPKLFIYRLGSGNAVLDPLIYENSDEGFYLPYIPVRLDNQFLSETFLSSGYEQAKEAYKRATTGNLDDVIDALAKSESLKDIDYAYVMFGVPLNTKDKAGKEYLYRFFDKLRLSQSADRDDYLIWRAAQQATDNAVEDWIAWRQDQEIPYEGQWGAPEPNIPSTYATPTNDIRIQGNGALSTNLDIQISWSSINLTTGSGLKKTGAKKGDYWVDYGGQEVFGENVSELMRDLGLNIGGISVDQIAISWQVDENNWKTLNITGLVHKNFIYKGKFVETSAATALSDAEESDFLVPIHYGTYKEMSMVNATQLATTCAYMVLNSYLVKKTGFFSSGFFKILLAVVLVAVTVATGGAGAAGVSLLGTNAAVGAALGLTGLAAVVAGFVANAIVAMILTKLLSVVSVAVFGDKWGQLIGAIVSFVALSVGSSMANGQNITNAFNTMLRPEVLLQLTSSVGNGISGIIAADAQKLVAETQDLLKDYEEQIKHLSNLFEENIGYDRALLDPLASVNNQSFYIEGRDSFLQRTLMTGSEIADLANHMLSNFTVITLDTSPIL